MDFQQIGAAFVNHYYGIFDANRAALIELYRDNSLLTFENAQIQGRQNIIGKLTSLTFQAVKHEVQTIDCQPSTSGGILVMVTGNLKTDNDPPHRFCQTFHLVAEGSNFWVSNDVFRLNYG